MINAQACRYCRFWFREPCEDDDKRHGTTTGECRAHAPVLTQRQCGGGYEAAPVIRIWPTTFSDDWCGDHR